MQKNISSKIYLVLLVVLSAAHFLLVVPAFQHPESYHMIDTYEYLDITENILDQHRYQGTIYPDVDLKRTPGYPLFLALGLVLGGGNIAIISLLQVVITLVITRFIFQIGKEIGQPKLGRIASLIYLLNPNATFWSVVLLSETVSAFWLILAVWGTLRFWKSRSSFYVVLAGVSLGLCTLTRPIALYLVWLWVFVLLWQEWKGSKSIHRANLTPAILLLIGMLVVVLPWQLRNAKVHGRFTISTVGYHTFEDWIIRKTLARAESISDQEAEAKINAQANPLSYSLEVIRRYPKIFLIEQIKGIARVLLGSEYGTWAKVLANQGVETTGGLGILFGGGDFRSFWQGVTSQKDNPWMWAGMYALLFDIVVYAVAAVGIIRIYRHNPKDMVKGLILLCLTGFIYLVIIPLGAGESRFRVPADPLLSVLAGCVAFSGN